MNNKLTGSLLTRAMLKNGHTEIWCAVDDESDERAVTDLENNDFTTCIVSTDADSFICSTGAKWLYAVPIKIVAITQEEVEL